MDKNFEKLMKSVETFMKGLDEFREDFEKLVKEETGKTLEELAKMPTETDEQKEEFINLMKKLKDAVDKKGNKKDKGADFSGNYIKIKGGKGFTSFEGSGNSATLIHMLVQGIATVLSRNTSLDDDRLNEFGKLLTDELKTIYKKIKEEN